MRRSRFVAALMLYAVLISHAQAHEMEGIDHVHLSDGVVQIIEPIPGVMPAPEAGPAQTEKGVASKATQPSGMMSLIVQLVLIGSALVLMVVVALKAGSRPRERRPTPPPKDTPSQPTPPG